MHLSEMLILLLVAVRASHCHLCKIWNVRVFCSNKNLTSVPQDLPEKIEKLDLSQNNIHELPNNSFIEYKKLEYISIYRNNLTILHNLSFAGLFNLRRLCLGDNNLRLSYAYPPNVFKPLISLEELDISNNRKISVYGPTHYPYFGALHNLQVLKIDLLNDPNFEQSGFISMSNLTVFVFDLCRISNLTNSTFKHMPENVQELHFRRCGAIKFVEANTLKPFSKLAHLIVYESDIELSDALKLLYPFENRNMTTVDFTKVYSGYQVSQTMSFPPATILTHEMMKHLQLVCTSSLILAENGIVDFAPNSLLNFAHPHCLKQIVFSGNRFSLLRDRRKLREIYIFCRDLINLELFDFSYNPLSYDKVYFIHNESYHRKTYDLRERVELLNTDNKESNGQHSGLMFYFYLPPKLEVLRLSHYLSKQGFTGNITIFNVRNLRHVDLSNFQLLTFPNVYFDGPTGIEYIDLSGINSLMLSSKDNIPYAENATTVIWKNAFIGQTLDRYDNIFRFTPQVENLDISFNSLRNLRENVFRFNKRIKNLSLEYNSLSDIPLAITTLPNLTRLDIRNNSIVTINSTIRNWIDEKSTNSSSFRLSLSGNQLECICDTMGFIDWMMTSDIIFDKPNKNYKCRLSNGSFSTVARVYLDYHDIFQGCNNTTWLLIGIGLLVTFIVMVIPIAVVINFRWKIAYSIYYRFRRVIKNRIKHQFRYDIYVSYSEESLNWVKNVLAIKLEKSWGFRLCIEDRDILAGEVCADAISRCISESRNIIFIVTDTFSNKIWGSFEIDRAKYEKYSKNLQQIIVITHCVSPENYPLELGHIQKDVTSIEWFESECENGWDKLRMALFTEFI